MFLAAKQQKKTKECRTLNYVHESNTVVQLSLAACLSGSPCGAVSRFVQGTRDCLCACRRVSVR